LITATAKFDGIAAVAQVSFQQNAISCCDAKLKSSRQPVRVKSEFPRCTIHVRSWTKPTLCGRCLASWQRPLFTIYDEPPGPKKTHPTHGPPHPLHKFINPHLYPRPAHRQQGGGAEFVCGTRDALGQGSVVFWENRCVKHLALHDMHTHEQIIRRVKIAGDMVV
jgi:hypothetical protein